MQRHVIVPDSGRVVKKTLPDGDLENLAQEIDALMRAVESEKELAQGPRARELSKAKRDLLKARDRVRTASRA